MQEEIFETSTKTEYRKTPLGKVPITWDDLEIGDLIAFSGGSQPPRSTFAYEPRKGYIRLIQTRDYRTDQYNTN
jgi:type I restriction enzyme S subunit